MITPQLLKQRPPLLPFSNAAFERLAFLLYPLHFHNLSFQKILAKDHIFVLQLISSFSINALLLKNQPSFFDAPGPSQNRSNDPLTQSYHPRSLFTLAPQYNGPEHHHSAIHSLNFRAKFYSCDLWYISLANMPQVVYIIDRPNDAKTCLCKHWLPPTKLHFERFRRLLGLTPYDPLFLRYFL